MIKLVGRSFRYLRYPLKLVGVVVLSLSMLLADWWAVLPYLNLPRIGQVRAATETFNSSTTWNAPSDVCEVTVEAWGGGAGGASGSAGGGGGGGAYTRGTVPVTPGNGYTVTVGAAASAGSGGNFSRFIGDGAVTVTGNGGSTGSSSTGGAGGAAVTVTGHIEASYAGGAGGDGWGSGGPSNRGGGGGGGSATSSANGNNGNNGTGSAGGTGGTGQATGGTGGRGATNGTVGGAPGAGGGGSGNASSAGGGAAGRIVLTYTVDPGCNSILTVGTTGTQTANLNFPATDQHVGGAFTLSTNGPTISVTQFVISELGTVNANTNLSNLQLYYKQEGSCSSTIPGDATVFNASGVSFNGSDQATVTGSMSVGSSQVCVYVELDLGAGATDGQTLEIQITNPSTQVTVSAGVSAPGTAVAISGTTTLDELTSDVTQSHYRWRNDDGSESSATWAAAEDTSLTSVVAESPYRLRFHLANLGIATSGALTYQLEVAAASVCSGGTYAPVPTDTSGHWQIVATDNLTDGGATTNVAGGLTDEGTSFVAGEVKDTGNTTGSITLDIDDFTEIEFSLQATTNAIEGGEYCFRLTNVTSYDVYAQATLAIDATEFGFQRKTIKDETQGVHWRFYYDNTDGDLAIDYSNNAGSSWTGITALSYTSSDFSVWNKNIGGTEYVWLAVASGDDIILRRGTLGATSITWDSASPLVVAFDGTGASDSYSYPYLTLDSSNYLWVMARHFDGTNYTIEAVRSTNLATTTWTSAAFVFETSTTLSADQTGSNVYGNLVPLSGQDMYAAFVVDTAIQGCLWDHSELGWKNSAGEGCVSGDPLAAHWTFDETASPSLDTTANNNDGTWVGDVGDTPGRFGNAAMFDGAGDVIVTDHSVSLSPTSGLSVSGWVKMDEAFEAGQGRSNQGVVDKGDYKFYLDKSDGKAKWVVNDATAKAFEALGGPDIGATNSVYTMAVDQVNNRLYISGYGFTHIGDTYVGGVAMWDGASFHALGGEGAEAGLNFPTNEYSVSAMIVVDGDLYVGGYFPRNNKYVTLWNITRYDPDDNEFYPIGGSGTSVGISSGGVISMNVLNGDIYVGGWFTTTTYGSITVNRITRYDPDTDTFHPLGGTGASAGVNSSVIAMTVLDGDLYVGGAFTTATNGTVTVNNIARYDPDTDTFHPLGGTGASAGVNSSVSALTIIDGDLYVGGDFTTATNGTVTLNYIARYDPIGDTFNPLGGTGTSAGVSSTVRSLVEFDGDIYLGGAFTTTTNGTVTVNRIARYDPIGDTFNPLGGTGTSAGVSSTVRSLVEFDGELYVGGEFISATNGTILLNFIGIYDSIGDNFEVLYGTNSNVQLSGGVNAITIYDGDLYIGGSFVTSSNGSVTLNRIARYDPDTDTFHPLGGTGASAGVNGQVNAMLVHDGNIYLGGFFTTATNGTVTLNYIARYDPDTDTFYSLGGTGVSAGVSSTVSAMTVLDGDLYLGGAFTTTTNATVTVNRIARYDPIGDTFNPLGGTGTSAGLSGTVGSITEYLGELYVGGAFATATNGTVTVNNVTRYDPGADTFNPMGGTGSTAGLAITCCGIGNVSAVVVYNNELFFSGGFWQTSGGGISNLGGLVKYNPSTNTFSKVSATDYLNGGNLVVRTMIVYNGELYFGGEFYEINQTSFNFKMAKYNQAADTLEPIVGAYGEKLGISGQLYAMGVLNGELYLGGFISGIAGGSRAGHLIKYSTPTNTTVASTTTSWTADTWYHVAATYSPAGLKMYVNGTLQSTTTSVPTSLASQEKDLLIGQTYGSQVTGGGEEGLVGSLDQLRIYSKALTADDVTALYQETAPIDSLKIDDASDFGVLPSGSGQLVRTSAGELYTFLNDGGSCEMWTSADGSSWSQVGTTNTCDSGADENVAAAIDGNDEIHVLFPTSNEVHYRKFTTSSDTWAAAAEVVVSSYVNITTFTVNNSWSGQIAIDSNNMPHIISTVRYTAPSFVTRAEYRNKVGGSWNSRIWIFSDSFTTSPYPGLDLIINSDNAPQASVVIDDGMFEIDLMTATAGTTNNPSSFTNYSVVNGINSTAGTAGGAMAMDSSDNTWVTYVTTGGTIGLVKHAAGTAWDNGANWTNITSKTDVGDEPSIAVHGTDVYVFYTNDTDDIAYDIYNGSSWAGEVVLETGTYQDAKVKWANYFNYGSNGLDYGGGASGIPELDYLFSDGTDVWYGQYQSGSSINISGGAPDEIATTIADLSKNLSAVSDLNNYDVHLTYIADSGTDYIAYKRYDTGTSTWDASAVSLAASDTLAYTSISVDATSHDLTAMYLDTSSGNISYRQCDVSGASSQCSTSGDWDTAVEWQTGEATALTSNYSGSGEVFALWSDTGAGLSIEWDLITMEAVLELIQNDFRWYVSEATLTSTNPWPDGPGGNLLENEVLTQLPASNRPPRAGDKLRLKINLTISGAALSADTQAFKLQYAAASQCSSASGWTDVGAKASGGVWRFYDETSVADQATAVNALSTSDTGAQGRFSEANPTSNNPNAVSIGQNSEWDWAIEHNSATSNSSYCFRMVKADDSPLDTYNPDSYPRLVTAPGTESLMRHGNFFQGETNQGFFWAE